LTLLLSYDIFSLSKIQEKPMFYQNRIIPIILCFGFACALPVQKTPQRRIETACPTANSERINDLTTQLLKEGIIREKLKAAVRELCDANQEIFSASFSLIILIEHLLKAKTAYPNPRAINFNKKELITGEYIFFNPSNIEHQMLCDKNGYMLPCHIKQHLKIGVFIHSSESSGLAYVYYPPQRTAFRCKIQEIIPQQKIVILKWKQ